MPLNVSGVRLRGRLMQKYTAKEAREQFSDLIAKAAHGTQRCVITKNGKDAAAIVPIADLELLAGIEQCIDVTEAKAAISKSGVEGTVSLKQLKKDLDL